MASHAPADVAASPAPAASLVAQQLERILASRHLAGSDRLKRFLRLIVEETLAGGSGALKEYTIGVQVYDRGETFDPKDDSIVRSEANRLRGRLAEYYADAATHDELRIDLPRGSYVPVFSASAGPTPVPGNPRRWLVWPALTIVVSSALVGGMLVGSKMRTEQPPSAGVVRMELGVAPAQEVNSGIARESGEVWPTTPGGTTTALAWMPDGRGLVFVGRRDGVRQLYVRQLDADQTRALPNTAGAQVPVVTPNGRAVVFWAGNAIRRVPLDGGPAQTIVKDVQVVPKGITVGENGVVFYGDGCEIWRSAGERTAGVTSPADGETCHMLPQLLPHDRVLVYTARRAVRVWGEEAVVAHVLATGVRKVVIRDGADARYVAGNLVFLRRGQLMAVPFSLDRLEVEGEPVGLVDGIAQALTSGHTANITGAGQFSVAPAGTLAYIPSPVVPPAEMALVTIDRRGRETDLPFERRNYGQLRLSPDGRSLALAISSLTETAIGIADLTRGSVTKLTSDGEAGSPRWTPDGQRIAFARDRNAVLQLMWQRVDGSTPPEPLADGDPSSWSPDGRQLVVAKDGDLWVLTLRDGQPGFSALTETPEWELSPEFSPDGKWLAYLSNRSGRLEVYVRAYPGPGPSRPVSIAGASPGGIAWNPRGNGELFFTGPLWAPRRPQMMAVMIKAGVPGIPRALFDLEYGLNWGCIPVRCYDVSPDGQRFFVTRQILGNPPTPVTHIHLVLNWVEELKAKRRMSDGR